MTHRRNTERGATLVEAAFVMIPFFLIIFAILEFGMAFRTDLTISNASQNGARAASVGGRDSATDFQIIAAIQEGLDHGGIANVERVIVYQADEPGDPIPPSCLAITNPIGPNGVDDRCNVYGPDAFFADLTTAAGTPSDEWQCAPSARDNFWCPADREVSFSLGPRDYIGVYVETNHEYVLGFFGDEVLLEATTVTRLEPEVS